MTWSSYFSFPGVAALFLNKRKQNDWIPWNICLLSVLFSLSLFLSLSLPPFIIHLVCRCASVAKQRRQMAVPPDGITPIQTSTQCLHEPTLPLTLSKLRRSHRQSPWSGPFHHTADETTGETQGRREIRCWVLNWIKPLVPLCARVLSDLIICCLRTSWGRCSLLILGWDAASPQNPQRKHKSSSDLLDTRSRVR